MQFSSELSHKRKQADDDQRLEDFISNSFEELSSGEVGAFCSNTHLSSVQAVLSGGGSDWHWGKGAKSKSESEKMKLTRPYHFYESEKNQTQTTFSLLIK